MRTLARSGSLVLIIVLIFHIGLRSALAQAPEPQPVAIVDSDHDGLSDALEQALLLQFAPTFMVSRHDCSKLPAEFIPNLETPTPEVEDGTIYGQVFLAKSATGDHPTAEIHFYHLWRSDCGPHSHPLDTEHVAVLVTASDRDLATAKWKALYWYAAAHEETVCDVSQITRASTLHAEQSGAKVFVSPGKHASYFTEKLCRSGCGADRCIDQVALTHGAIINLGEPGHPMNGSIFIASSQWPLLGKMTNTNFPPEPVARLNQLPETSIAWFNPGKHPAQGIISNSNTTKKAIATGANSTTSSLAVAQNNTGNALQKSAKATGNALGTTVKHVGEALHPVKKTPKPQ
jgi:hypothetical protein